MKKILIFAVSIMVLSCTLKAQANVLPNPKPNEVKITSIEDGVKQIKVIAREILSLSIEKDSKKIVELSEKSDEVYKAITTKYTKEQLSANINWCAEWCIAVGQQCAINCNGNPSCGLVCVINRSSCIDHCVEDD